MTKHTSRLANAQSCSAPAILSPTEPPRATPVRVLYHESMTDSRILHLSPSPSLHHSPIPHSADFLFLSPLIHSNLEFWFLLFSLAHFPPFPSLPPPSPPLSLSLSLPLPLPLPPSSSLPISPPRLSFPSWSSLLGLDLFDTAPRSGASPSGPLALRFMRSSRIPS
ncbi:hypothetical protein P168DRAFT_66240 [Aspergillus campestris IBT 28561]|uniref:Uncharacterized protein n=1 Tax=Aspergillus campestris (strain IBT 28561) TaxID=1392248 RepID=A0A2I1CTC1_ASPC2|nr:uncharacterized protein P168DRAFT_66240 [Aspergillus campestris IBT 28561]PKY00880.1 hypothetical protein P168DRAFT_66240 [Aspergillus campestris IBT 28561]